MSTNVRDYAAETELDEAAIRARLEAATPGPWRFSNTTDPRGRKGEFRAPSPHNGFMIVGPWTNDADARFIAAARTDVERLLAALDEARANAADTIGGRRVARLHESYRGQIAAAFEAEAAALARAEAAESRLRDMEIERNMLRESLAGVLAKGQAAESALADAALATPTTERVCPHDEPLSDPCQECYFDANADLATPTTPEETQP